MDQLLPRLYREYGQYSNWRSFPFSLDGLKPVERRVLLAAYQIARNKLTKSARVDGHVTGNFHPHGSAYGTIVQLVRQGFLHGQGNFGCNVGVEPVGPAASRYTEVQLSKQMVDFAFKYIDFVSWFTNELDQKEPKFLPVMLPMCLMGVEFTQGIGFGYKTFIPCYSPNDLYKRLKWLKGLRKTKPIIEPLTDCKILSGKRSLEKLLTKGKAHIDVEGVYDVDYRHHKVVLRSWPPGKKFETILKKFATWFDNSSIGFSDLSTDHTEIVFQVLRERNQSKILSDFEKGLKEVLQGTLAFETNVIDKNNKVVVKPIDEMLSETYEMFQISNINMLMDKMSQLKELENELNMLRIIKDPLKACLSYEMNVKDSIDYIHEITKLEKNDINNIIRKYHIRRLLTINTETEQIEKEMKEVGDILEDIQPYVIEQYDAIFGG